VYASDPAPLRYDETLLRPRTAPRRSSTAHSIVRSIGHTPLLELDSLKAGLPPGSSVWGKAEFLNPTGSVKDRAARAIVETAMRSGELGPGRRLLDASSGNTAVAYAMLGARLRFPVTICLPRTASADRVRRIRAYGGEVIFTDPIDGTDGAQRLAKEIAQADPSRFFYADQYNNAANSEAHYRTTGPEVWNQTKGRVTHLVAGVGTGGTISGIARYLKERRSSIQVIGVEPDGPLHGIEGLKHLPTALRPGVYDEHVVDLTRRVSTETARRWADRLAREEGLLLGTSSGAAIAVAFEEARAGPDRTVVGILPDQGERRAEPEGGEE
jgi:S-sulfo-L-cysteine synthase (O-acetyl-L-serine-dependent)